MRSGGKLGRRKLGFMVDVPESNIPIFERYMVRCESQNGWQEGISLEESGRLCSNYTKHSRLTNQHDWGDLYGQLMTMNKDVHMSLRHYETNDYGHDSDLLTLSH